MPSDPHLTAMLAVVLFTTAIVWLYVARVRAVHRREREIEGYLAAIEALQRSRNTLLDRLDSQVDRERRLKELLEGRFALMRSLAATYYTYGNLRQLSDRIRELSTDAAFRRDLGEMVDLHYDGALTRLRRTLPSLSERDADFAALLIAGFSPQEISAVTGDSLNSIYLRKSRLRRRLAACGAEVPRYFD